MPLSLIASILTKDRLSESLHDGLLRLAELLFNEISMMTLIDWGILTYDYILL